MTYSQEERRELFDVLNACTGIAHIEIHEVHAKGGYRVTFEIAPNAFDAFVLLLASHDWVSVI
jgi:hypothetical protein